MRYRSLLILAAGFTLLSALTSAAGLLSMRRTSSAVRELALYQQNERLYSRRLRELQDQVFQGAVLIRDFLIERNTPEAEVLRSEVEQLLRELDRNVVEVLAVGPSRQEANGRLRKTLDSFSRSLRSLLDADQHALSSDALLLSQAARSRAEVFVITSDLRNLAVSDLERAQDSILGGAEDTDEFVSRLWAATVALNLIVAAIALVWISVLERRAEASRIQIEADREELRLLSNRVVHVQEEERKFLSRELHDQVGQMLTALRLEIRAMADAKNSVAAQFDHHYREALTFAERTLSVVSDLAMGLRPSMLDVLGLGPAIEWLARDFSRRAGVAADVRIEDLPDVPDSHRTCIFRIAQESLTNIVRHADARHVRLALRGGIDQLILTIEDDGKGIDQASFHRGLGMLGIEERARELKGVVSISSWAGKGTVLRVELPLS